jgi:exo-beta-1,3-glucanase (GH17 family)
MILPALHADNAPDEGSITKREFNPTLNGHWIGNGISYSAYRDGEGPDMQGTTSKQNILEDLKLIAQRWHLIRLYGADQQHQNILEVIRDHKLPIRVMQGAWLSGHYTREQNDEQVDKVIEMANEFPQIIVAVNVGNEIFVDWSWHKVKDMDEVIAYLRKVRANINQPVTVNDDYNFWNKPAAKKIAAEIDFIGLHAYAFWNNKTLKESMAWTEAIYRDIQQRHPDHLIAYTETGWPTSRVYDDSYEGGLIGKAGENEQKIFFDQYNEWVNQNNIISLYFSSFDEQWKGGFDGQDAMNKAEKHWGVYRSDRTPKKLLKPVLMTP